MRRFFAALVLAALCFAGCGVAERLPPLLGPTPLFDSTFEVDQVLVNFRVERVEEFQASEFRFNGSVKNNGVDRPGARFEVVSTRNIADPNGNRASQVIAVEPYGILLTSQTQPISIVAVVPNVDNVSITGRFAHD